MGVHRLGRNGLKAEAACLVILSMLALAVDAAAGPRPADHPEPRAAALLSTKAGWYLDGVRVVADEHHIMLKEDFETGAPNWTHWGEGDEWEFGAPAGPIGPDTVPEGIFCAATDLDGAYAQPSNCTLQSADFNLTMAFSASLVYDDWHDIAPGDSAFVSIEAFIGGWWMESDPIAISGTSDQWLQRSIDFTQFTKAGQPFASVGCEKVHLKFRLECRPSNAPRLEALPGDRYVRLEWCPPLQTATPVTGYNLYRGLSPGALDRLAELGNCTSYNDTNVTNGVTHYYCLAAVTAFGEGEWSEMVEATPGAVPGPPRNPRLNAGTGFLNLSWEPPADDGGFCITRYNIYRRTGATGTRLFTVWGTGRHYVDKEVSNDSTYCYTVTAFNKYGEGPLSPEVSGSPGSPPSPPRDLRAWGEGASIRLAWNPPADVERHPVGEYTVHRRNGTGSWAEVSRTPKANATDQLGQSEKLVYYNVTSLNEFGVSEPCPAAWLGRPTAPHALEAVPQNGFMELRWEAPHIDNGAAVYRYNIYRCVNGSPMLLCGFTPDNGTFYDDIYTPYGVNCSYCVTAVNAVGESDAAGPASPSYDWTLPEIMALWPVAGDWLNTSAIALSGYAFDPSGVVLVEATSDGNKWVRCNGTADWQATLSLPEGPAAVVVRATDRAGNINTTTIKFTIDLSPPAVSITAPADGSVLRTDHVSLSGKASDGGLLYTVDLSADGTVWSRAQGIGCWTGPLPLRPGTNVLYARAMDAAGNSALASITLLYDTQEPAISILGPGGPRHIRHGDAQNITLEGNASDDLWISSVKVCVDGKEWLDAIGNESWRCMLSLDPGTHKVHAWATDAAGRKAVADLEVVVEPPPSISTSLPFYLIGLLAAILVAGAGIWLARGRLRRKKQG